MLHLYAAVVEGDRAVTLVFRLSRQEREAWITWPVWVAALMAANLSVLRAEAQATVGTGAMRQILETHTLAEIGL